MTAAQTENKLATEQARTIRTALAAGRSLLAWSATLADGRTIVVLATTDRAAHAVALASGSSPLRVGRAAVRDVPGYAARCLAAVPAPAPKPAKAPSPAKRELTPAEREAEARFQSEWKELLAEEERAELARAQVRYWTTGEGSRPATSPRRAGRPRAAGEPRVQITARPRPGVGSPFVGEATLRGTGLGVRLAHEFVRRAAPASQWNPGLPVGFGGSL